MQSEKKHLFFQQKNTFVKKKNTCFFQKKSLLWRKKHDLRKKTLKSVFFIIKYALKKNKLSLVCYKNDITQNALFFRGSF